MAFYALNRVLSAGTLSVVLFTPSLQAGSTSEPSGTETKAEKTPIIQFETVLMVDGSVFEGVYGDSDTQTDVEIRRRSFGMAVGDYKHRGN